jgi:dimethyladenosine transferase
MNVYDETQFILHKYKIQANKSLGQNFLVNDNVIDEIIRGSNIDKQDLIIEIGPGLGVLTNRLLQESNNVVAVELDKRMVNILKDRFAQNINDQAESKLEIINEDILKINLNQLIAEKRKNQEIKQVKIVANLPYYISTPIIMKLLENRLDIDEIIVMVQQEVAERLIAKTGTRLAGAITYAVEYYSEATSLIKVPKESFVPSPKVESEVIKLKVRKDEKIHVENEKLLFNIISKSFMQRRKTLSNALLNNNIMKNKDDVKKMWTELGMDENVRGESLTLEQFGKITDYIENINKKSNAPL